MAYSLSDMAQFVQDAVAHGAKTTSDDSCLKSVYICCELRAYHVVFLTDRRVYKLITSASNGIEHCEWLNPRNVHEWYAHLGIPRR